MSPDIKIERASGIPADIRVHHYDELDELEKEQFPALAADIEEHGTVDGNGIPEMAKYEVIKFTDYYRVESS